MSGAVIHTEVGHCPANAFGLHEVSGNLNQWCLDGDANCSSEKAKDPVAPWRGSRVHVAGGGCYDSAAQSARSAVRVPASAQHGNASLGLCPARSVTP